MPEVTRTIDDEGLGIVTAVDRAGAAQTRTPFFELAHQSLIHEHCPDRDAVFELLER